MTWHEKDEENGSAVKRDDGERRRRRASLAYVRMHIHGREQKEVRARG